MKALQVLVLFMIVLFSGLSVLDSQTNQDITEIEWSNDGSKLAVGYRNGTFRIFHSSDMTVLFEQLTTDASVSEFAWNSSDTKLAIGHFLNRVDIWDMANFQKILTLSTGSFENNHLIWMGDNDTLFVGDAFDIPTLEFDTNNGSLLNAYSPAHSLLIQLKYSDMFITHWFDTIYFINSNTRSVIDEINFDDEFGRIFILQVSPDEDLIAIGVIQNIIYILDIQSRQIIAILDGGQETHRQLGITNLAFNETGSRLFTATQTGTIRSWDTSTWQMIDSIELNSLGLTFIADFSPDARRLAYANWEQGSQLLMLDLCDFVASDVASLLTIFPQANIFGEEAQICLTENATYTLTASLPDITGNITFIGNGAQIVMTGGAHVFNVTATGRLTLKDVSLLGNQGE